VAVPFLKRNEECLGEENSKKKEGEGTFRKKSSSSAGQIFLTGRAVKKYARYSYHRAHEQHKKKRERERERERGSTFSERKMSATPSALKASPQEVNAEEVNVLASRDDDEDEEEQKEEEEKERGPSVGKEEEQEECVVFFFSLCYLFLNGDDDD